MDNIKIFDNFLSKDEYNYINTYLKQPVWEFGHESISDSKEITTPFWVCNLIENSVIISLLEKIENLTNKKFKINRVYANGQTYGQDGSYHQDNEETNTYTFCFYITNSSISNIDIIGGQIEFKLPNTEDYSVRFNTYNNRALFFPSNYFHRGCSYSRYVSGIRVCIAYKLEEII